MRVSLSGLKIGGIAAALPKQIFEIKELAELYGENEVNRIMMSTGVQRIRIAADDLCASDYCEHAAISLLHSLAINPRTIDGIIFVSQTPDYILPATSTILQYRLSLPTSAVAFDINYGCSGYIYGLFQAALLVNSGSCRRVLVCAGDVTTRLINPLDRSVRMVFGDGASATVVEKGFDIMTFCIKTYGSGYRNLIIPAGGFRMPKSLRTGEDRECEDGNIRSENDLFMNGLEIMSFALKEVPLIITEILEACQWRKEEVGTYALHQANKFMIDYLRKKMKIDIEAVPIAVSETGNTGPASIPLMLAFENNRLREKGRLDKVVACGFGVGLSLGAATLNLSQTKILEPIEV